MKSLRENKYEEFKVEYSKYEEFKVEQVWRVWKGIIKKSLK